MDDKKYVISETLRMLLLHSICTAISFLVFFLLHRWDLTVLWGGLAGTVIAVGNFFFLAVTACMASQRAVTQDVEGGKKLMKLSQTYRFLGIGALLVVCGISGYCNLIALVLPLLLQSPILKLSAFFRKKEV